jgi:hypothetical protein
MIFGRSGDPAHTMPGFAARHADLLVPIDADIAGIMPRLSGIVNSTAVESLRRTIWPQALLRSPPIL